ncbi:MAG: hypothetical protein HAW63_02510 [Bdellovibrionaceae bacterium]|nr:hypothetical protein [Pseudobdellovibrionaceae bacterium]
MKLFFTLFLFLNSCQSGSLLQPLYTKHSSTLKKEVKIKNIYNSFDSVYTVKALWLNQEKIQTALKKQLQSVSSSATTNNTQLLLAKDYVIFFVSLYTSNFNYKNLRNQKVWNITLQTNNKKYSSKILASPFAQEQTHFLFPFHNSFSKGFFVKFNIHPNQINSSSKLIFYSFLGNSTIAHLVK